MSNTYKLECKINPNYTHLITQYIQKHTWEEYAFILKWREFMFSKGMYYLNGAHVYFDEFKTISLKDDIMTATHPSKEFLEGFNTYVIPYIGYGYKPSITVDDTLDNYQKDMCFTALTCHVHGLQFDLQKFLQWYSLLDPAHIKNMQKDPALIRATLDYDLGYRSFFR